MPLVFGIHDLDLRWLARLERDVAELHPPIRAHLEPELADVLQRQLAEGGGLLFESLATRVRSRGGMLLALLVHGDDARFPFLYRMCHRDHRASCLLGRLRERDLPRMAFSIMAGGGAARRAWFRAQRLPSSPAKSDLQVGGVGRAGELHRGLPHVRE